MAVPEFSSHHTSPEVSLTYTPTDWATAFASYKEAAKSGSFSTVTIVNPGTNTAFADEGAKGEEIGLKTQLLDDTLRVNVDAYHYEYSNLQVGANIVTNGVINDETLNAASATGTLIVEHG